MNIPGILFRDANPQWQLYMVTKTAPTMRMIADEAFYLGQLCAVNGIVVGALSRS